MKSTAHESTAKGAPIIESCYNKFGCPYNAKHAKQLNLREEQSLSEKKPKFTRVKLQVRDETVTLCCYCYDCFKKNEKCDYCFQVYFSGDQNAEVDGEVWISCDKCLKWNHPKCEELYGAD